MDQRQRDALDAHITGHYGEDQFRDMPDEAEEVTPVTTKTMDVTPTFNYQKHVEILKRFIERLTAQSNTIALHDPDLDRHAEPAEWGMADYVAEALPFVREAMSELLADDVTLQIKTNIFPIRIQLSFHAFAQDYPGDWPLGKPENCSHCGMVRSVIQHAL